MIDGLKDAIDLLIVVNVLEIIILFLLLGVGYQWGYSAGQQDLYKKAEKKREKEGK